MSTAESHDSHAETPAGLQVQRTYLGPVASGLSQTEPGTFPFTRGLHRRGYTDHSWVKKLISGYGTAEETRDRQIALWNAGQEGVKGAKPLHIVVDIPTADGYDSDDPRAIDEVGLCGMAIDSVEDIQVLVDGLPLDKLTSTFILAGPAPMVLAMYIVVLEEAGIDVAEVAGQVWNNPLSEYVTSMWPTLSPEAAVRTMTDTMRFCATRTPKFRAVNLDGYNVREAGTSAVQEVAYMIAEAVDLVRLAGEGTDIPPADLLRTLTVSWAVHSDFFEEIAKFRAARQVYAEIMAEKFRIDDHDALKLKAHAQTAGSTLTAQMPVANVARVSMEALAAVLGGCQSMHTSSFDEALGIPTEESAQVALTTQHIIDKESGVRRVVDPLAGSFYLEDLTQRLAAAVRAEVDRIESLGGFVEAVKSQDLQQRVADAAFEYEQRVESGETSIVGVNFLPVEPGTVEVFEVSETSQAAQIAAVRSVRQRRDPAAFERAMEEVRRAVADPTASLMQALIGAARARATLGEMTQAVQAVLGGYERESILAR